MTELQRAMAALIEAAGSGAALGRKHKISKAFIYNVRDGKRGMSPTMCRRLGLPESLGTIESTESWRAGWAAARARNAKLTSPRSEAEVSASFREQIQSRAAEERRRNLAALTRPRKPATGESGIRETVAEHMRREARLGMRGGEVAGG